jgi:hypothetical protein
MVCRATSFQLIRLAKPVKRGDYSTHLIGLQGASHLIKKATESAASPHEKKILTAWLIGFTLRLSQSHLHRSAPFLMGF